MRPSTAFFLPLCFQGQGSFSLEAVPGLLTLCLLWPALALTHRWTHNSFSLVPYPHPSCTHGQFMSLNFLCKSRSFLAQPFKVVGPYHLLYGDSPYHPDIIYRTVMVLAWSFSRSPYGISGGLPSLSFLDFSNSICVHLLLFIYPALYTVLC